jgi:hypothetical protein
VRLTGIELSRRRATKNAARQTRPVQIFSTRLLCVAVLASGLFLVTIRAFYSRVRQHWKPDKGGCVMGTPLRDHPLMRRGPVSNWPPFWTQWSEGGGMTMLKGEIGVVRYVHLTTQDSKRCHLVIEYNGQHYVGTLLFDDSAFCSQICALLQQQLGRSIKDIGDLEVSFTPK